MKETFILANGLNGNELSRSLAKTGTNTFALRVINSTDLAKVALISSGIILNKKQINSVEQAAIIYSFLNEIEYFKNGSYTDACNLVLAFHLMRSCVVEGDELDEIRERMSHGAFTKKNDAIVEAYVRYSNYLYQNDLIDADGIIREAVNNSKSMDVDFISLKEYELNPLEKKLLEIVSNDSAVEKSILDLYKANKTKTNFNEVSKAYGAINEVENIIEDIYKNHKLDECVIACANCKVYNQLIYNLSLQYKIPVTFAKGISINNSNPAKLLNALVQWDSLGFNGVDALYELLSCEALDWRFLARAIDFEGDVTDNFICELSEYVGNLKLSTNSNNNDLKLSKIKNIDEKFGYASKLAKIFENGVINFLETYTFIREENSIDKLALEAIVNELEIFTKYNPDKLMAEVIPEITNNFIGGMLSCEGNIHVTTLNGLYSQSRKYVYICGLSANEFPGNAKENYLLLDSDLENFNDAKLSESKVLDNVELFDNLLEVLSSLGCKIKLSYSYFNLSELKDQNASSVLYKLVNDFEKIKTVNYFDSHLSASREICNLYKNGVDVNYKIDTPQAKCENNLLERAWSFSAIDTYLKCPRKFYLRYVLKVPEIEEHDPFEVLNAREFGDLAHGMMAILGKEKISKPIFLNKCQQAFEDFLTDKPALIESKKESAKQEFMNTMSLAYDFDVTVLNKTEIAEQYMEAKHDASGVILHGIPDRIEGEKNNVCVVDFKTGRDIKHKQNDVKSCLQAIIYAYVYQKNHPEIKVNCAEFRYLRNSGVVSCVIDDDVIAQMDEILKDFADGIKENNFERCTKNCNYCSYNNMCLWPGETDDEKEGSNE